MYFLLPIICRYSLYQEHTPCCSIHRWWHWVGLPPFSSQTAPWRPGQADCTDHTTAATHGNTPMTEHNRDFMLNTVHSILIIIHIINTCTVYVYGLVCYLIGSLQLLLLHLPQHVVSRAQSAHFRVTGPDKSRQADEPEAVAMTQQTLGPHLRHGGVGLGHPLSRFDLLQLKGTC